MTARKAELKLPPRTTAYVDRVAGAAELLISPDTWDEWVQAGILPPASPGFPESTPRWRWQDVDEKLSGKKKNNTEDKMIEAAKNFRSYGTTKKDKRAVA